MNSNPIGIFDSGMGGLSVLSLASKNLPSENFIYYGDSINAPYGVKSKEEVVELSIKICDYFISKKVKAIVIACNTATSVAVKALRNRYDIPIIGMEPALKPAIEKSNNKSIAVMATPMTLKEEKFKLLLDTIGANKNVYKIPAPKIVDYVESGCISGEKIDNILKEYFVEINLDEVESVVLGCTHFVFIKHSIEKLFNSDIILYDGNKGTVEQLIRRLKKYDLLNIKEYTGNIEIINTGGVQYVERSKQLFDFYRRENWK